MKIDIERVKELLAAATPGPWLIPNPSPRIQTVEAGNSFICEAHDDDAPLIAAAPDIARLAIELSEEVERLKREMKIMEAAHAVVTRYGDVMERLSRSRYEE